MTSCGWCGWQGTMRWFLGTKRKRPIPSGVRSARSVRWLELLPIRQSCDPAQPRVRWAPPDPKSTRQGRTPGAPPSIRSCSAHPLPGLACACSGRYPACVARDSHRSKQLLEQPDACRGTHVTPAIPARRQHACPPGPAGCAETRNFPWTHQPTLQTTTREWHRCPWSMRRLQTSQQ